MLSKHKQQFVQLLVVVALLGLGLSVLAAPTALTVTPYADLVRFSGQGQLEVQVFSLTGKVLFAGSNAGALDWNTQHVASGVYLYTVMVDGKKQIGKVAVVRGQGVLAPSLVTLPSVGQIAVPQHTGSWDLDHGANAYTLNASNFGFGTQTPTQYFQIVTPSGSTIRPMELDAGSSTVAPCLYMKNGLASPSTYHFCTWSTGDKFSFTRTGVADYLVIDRTGATPSIQLLNADVGVNTASPNGKLHAVQGSTAGSAFALHGEITSTSPGGFSAGVRGESQGTGPNGIGVYGSQNGSGWGVYGTTPSGRGVYGFSSTGSGTGVYASNASTTGTALAIGTGALRVSGAGIGTSTTVFIHKATAANIFGHITTITNPLTDGDPGAILIVTQNWSPASVYNAHEIGVYYDGSQWNIFNEDFAGMPVGAAFNILVVKP